MKFKSSIIVLIFSLRAFNTFSQDSVFVYDIASQTLTGKLLPSYNLNIASDSTNPFFGVHGVSNIPAALPTNTYPASNISLLQKASDFYSTFNFPFSAVSLIRYGHNITSAVIGKRALLVFNYDVRQPNSHWRSLSDNNPFYENGSIQYGFGQLTPVKYYTLDSPDTNTILLAVVEVAEDIGIDAGYFGLAFDTTSNAYDSLMLYNISYPKEDIFNLYPDSTNGDTLCLKYGLLDSYNQYGFQAFYGGEGEYDSPFFDENFRVRGIRWSFQSNYFINRKGFYFLKYVIDSLATSINEIQSNATFNIFPNPAADNIIVRLEKPLTSNASFTISNSLGELVETRNLSSRDLEIQINVAGFAKGIYIVRIIDSEGVRIKKIFKQ